MLSTKQIFLIACLLCFVTFLVLFSFRENGVKGIRQVILGCVLGMAGNILYAYGRELAPFFGYEMANGTYAAASAAMLVGYRKLFKRPPHIRLLAGLVAGLTVATGVFHYVFDSFEARTAITSLFQAGVAAAIGFTVLQARQEWRRPYSANHFILGMCALIAGGHVFRVFYQLLTAGAPRSLLEPTGWNTLILAAGAFALPVLALGALLTAHRRIVLMAEHAANQDYLTGAWSRRAFFDVGGRELARARRNGRPVSLLLIDLDHFKPINDTHGHDAGDTVLKGFVQQALLELRRVDCLCRMGGDEFAVLMPETDLPGASTVANRLRLRIAQEQASLLGITLSIGIATLNKEDDLKSLVSRADRALYAAKDRGRNAVSVETDTLSA
ncbi:GGDEF domain-containing protein [Noviherbaspirillum galbum]|uniref:diguanylate cyclase n=1 Tax=Noviherbaspirillum galbum TaxID=2709383 RepID=A0A6B3SXQ3_9BURK|nr:GGDEF domain-containing protein [Noviherbaspirillum galbum]NEX62569.1 GGDEF domain-containing protein [Noviherbaspirillum galbum]